MRFPVRDSPLGASLVYTEGVFSRKTFGTADFSLDHVDSTTKTRPLRTFEASREVQRREGRRGQLHEHTISDTMVIGELCTCTSYLSKCGTRTVLQSVAAASLETCQRAPPRKLAPTHQGQLEVSSDGEEEGRLYRCSDAPMLKLVSAAEAAGGDYLRDICRCE